MARTLTGLGIAAAVLVTGCATPMFTLRRESDGRRFGPYLFVHGQRIRLGEDTFVVQKEQTPDRRIEDTMRALVIPQVDFKDACVWDIVGFLRRSGKYEDAHTEGDEPPVDIVLVIPEGKQAQIPRVWLEAQSISLLTTLQTVAKLARLQFSIHDGRAWLEFKER